MCIYCGTNKYRQIYKNHYGDIPIDSIGRKYDIHHIDGNHSNNDPNNLVAVTLQEHYDIHYKQGDFVSCSLINRKLHIPHDEYSKLCTLSNKKRVKDGDHNLLRRADGSSVSSDRVKNGTHHLLGKGPKHPKVDKNVYCFENKISKEQVWATQYEFVRKYDICQSNVSRLINRKLNSTHNWRIVR
jgi:hypothetical protein